MNIKNRFIFSFRSLWKLFQPIILDVLGKYFIFVSVFKIRTYFFVDAQGDPNYMMSFPTFCLNIDVT